MTQKELYQQISNATGDDIDTIRRMGFEPFAPIDTDEREPLVVDWDLLESSR